MKPQPKHPFYGNQHVTPAQAAARVTVNDKQATRGPTNRQLYLERVARGEPVPPSPLLAELGESKYGKPVPVPVVPCEGVRQEREHTPESPSNSVDANKEVCEPAQHQSDAPSVNEGAAR
jgi:hypothetical protein